jgi:eukaryotic-like serine/threonine-protein kinase
LNPTAAALDGRVQLKGLLGAGGVGEVHRAWDGALQRPVAVKFPLSSDPREAERLLLEARLQARVDHPSVVRVLEVGTLGGRPCIVLQLVEGCSLAVFAPGASLAERVELLRQAAEGLHAAHREGLVHRDVKPGNVLVERSGSTPRALVSDFGLARGDEPGLTRTGLAPGTLEYMSPEALLDDGPIDFRADVYSLGATLYSILAGRPPFRRSAEEAALADATSLLRRLLEEDPAPLPPEVPVELRRVVAKAMEKEPRSRYASAEALADDLRRFQRGEPVLARPAPAPERLLRWTRRNRTATRALAAALVMLLGTLGFGLWMQRRSGLEALEAARLGALAESFDSTMRLEHLAPLHDIRPALAGLRPQVEALRPLAASARGGPASYALGTGLDLLGDLAGARTAYTRAWELGFRGPRVAEALGSVLARVYEAERARALERLGPSALAERLEQLRLELRDPAVRYLALGDPSGWRGPWLRASMALLEGDLPAARRHANELLAIAPERYQARVLQGETWLGEANRAALGEQLDQALDALGRAEGLLEAAAEWGRSDPRPALLAAAAHSQHAGILTRRGQVPAAEAATAERWLERASRIDPDSRALLVERALLLLNLERFAANYGRRQGLDRVQEAAGLLRRAVKLAPDDVETLHALLVALLRSGHHRVERGLPALEVLDEGAAAHAVLVALAPNDGMVHARGAELHLLRGKAQQAAGLPAAAALQAAEREAAAAMRLDPIAPLIIRAVLAETLVLRGREDWLTGSDPRPTLQRAAAVVEELRFGTGQSVVGVYRSAYVLASVALALLDTAEEAGPILARALVLTAEARAAHPDMPLVPYLRGQILVIEARRLQAAGQDPGPVIAESRSLIRDAVRRMGHPDVAIETMGLLSLTEARWGTRRGGDPSKALDAAERAFREVEANEPSNPGGPFGLAACALERARALRERGRAVAAKALDEAGKARALDRRDPQLRVLLARLQGLAGDREAGRAGLASALEAAPLLGRTPEAQAAALELAAR